MEENIITKVVCLEILRTFLNVIPVFSERGQKERRQDMKRDS
jgi:hypothetical protein